MPFLSSANQSLCVLWLDTSCSGQAPTLVNMQQVLTHVQSERPVTQIANRLRRGCCRFRVGTSHRLVIGKQPGDASLGPVTPAAVVGGLKVSRLPHFLLRPRPPPSLPALQLQRSAEAQSYARLHAVTLRRAPEVLYIAGLYLKLQLCTCLDAQLSRCTFAAMHN